MLKFGLGLFALVTILVSLNLTTTGSSQAQVAPVELGFAGFDTAYFPRQIVGPIPTVIGGAYGLYTPTGPNIFIFDELRIGPSTLTRTFDVPITDPQASQIAAAIYAGNPPAEFSFAACSWLPPGDLENNLINTDANCNINPQFQQIKLPVGGQIDFFRFTLNPFSIQDLGDGTYLISSLSLRYSAYGHIGPTATPTLTPSLTPTPVVKAHKVVIFVQGYASCLTNGQEVGPSCDASGANPYALIKNELRNNGFTDNDFIEFSYTGNSVDKNTQRWVSKDYGCTDVTNQSYKQPAKDLIDTIRDYKKTHPSYQIYVIGHSFGGLVAFQALAQEIDRRGLNDRSTLSIAGLVTIDSPLNGVDRSWGRTFADWVLSSIPRILDKCSKDMLNSNATDSVVRLYENWQGGLIKDPARSAVEESNSLFKSVAIQSGTSVTNIGNLFDCFWSPSLCSPYDIKNDPFSAGSAGRTDYTNTQFIGTQQNIQVIGVPSCKAIKPNKPCTINEDVLGTHSFVLKDSSLVATTVRQQISTTNVGQQR